MSEKLANKVAVITGGTSGIGLSIAKRFVQEGAMVVITGRKQSKINRSLSEIGGGAVGMAGDVSNLADLDRIYGIINEQFGKIDVLIANAGVYLLAPVDVFSEQQFEKLTDINFKGTFFTVQKALPLLKEGSSVILISSTVSQKGAPNHSVYAATKAAVRSLARSFSAELVERKIRVNVLSPGPIDTPVFETVTGSAEEADAFKAMMGSVTPVKRMGSSAEVAAAALYLALDDSAFMLGAEILLDGGIRDL
ncbi:SDR family oxidoreductase [Mucilaginibacter agri]|uniref:SDR family oxidoreductase n=1 Tax=Mucilaginibacter agri TaxID=2695265 RepID=A0A965ZFF3_9SPHI|nr:SDR family oxidoreductase [Mucilaginibacter agri]NCD69117.1 SDR family oxidoreductase [Mucilaginibacter agri]